MGALISNLLEYFFGKEELRILMLGLDAAGKTTILHQLHAGEAITTVPTIGFNVETVEYKKVSFTVWDVGGQQHNRNLWPHYYANTAAIIFVVDASDRDRIAEAAEELHMLVGAEELRNAVLLVLANKQDLPHALSTTELVERMELHRITKRWQVQATCATGNKGVYDVLRSLSEMLNRPRRNVE